MASPRIILGRITEVSGTSPGPASGITYTIACHDEQVDGVFRVTNQRPIRRWPDTIDTVAFVVGSMVIGVTDANILQWHSMEMPDFGECPSNGNPSVGFTPRQLVTETDRIIMPLGQQNVQTTGSQGGSENTPSGGDTNP